MKVNAFKVPMNAPQDVSAARKLMDEGILKADKVVAILGKTEGNGGINDYTRTFATQSFLALISEKSGIPVDDLEWKIPIIWSGGTDGVMSPHATIFTREPSNEKADGKRLVIGVAFSEPILPEELGRVAMVHKVADSVRVAMKDAGITDVADIKFVQTKSPVLTAERMRQAAARGHDTVTTDCTNSMAYSRAASGLGVALALGEVGESQISDEVIDRDWNLFSRVSSASAGLEIVRCETIVFGNSDRTGGELRIGNAEMQDAIDADAVKAALKDAGLKFDCCPTASELEKLINVFVKCDADPRGVVRGRRHVMMEDSDVHHSRQIRSTVAAVIASVTGDTACYVSAGSEHQGPLGGGPVAAIARV